MKTQRLTEGQTQTNMKPPSKNPKPKIKPAPQKSMKKPGLVQRDPVMDFHAMIDYVEKKHDIDVRDYAGKWSRQAEWSELNGGVSLYAAPQHYDGKYYAWIDGKGEKVQVNKKEYDEQWEIHRSYSKKFADWDKEQGELPYLDYWHWLLDKCFYEISNGSTAYWDIGNILEEEDTPDWVKEITQLVHDEFKDNLDDGGGVKVLISW